MESMTMPPKKKAAKKAPAEDGRVAIIHLKGSAEYAEWLESFHKTTHLQKTTLVRLGLAEIAKKLGHKAPPEL